MKRLEAAEEGRYRAGLAGSVRAGLAALAASGSALDAVQAAVLFMEDSGDFNAGDGACLDEEGNASLDAALMRGSDLAAGAVGASSATRNPIVLCRHLLDEGKHVLLVATGADRRARQLGLRPLSPLDERRKKVWRAMLEERSKTGQEPTDRLAATSRPSTRLSLQKDGVTEAESHDTVGAAAVDAEGRVAAAVSTGGLWLKAVGRVGDSAVVGGGLYASDALGGAAVATGIGEKILRITLCRDAVDRLGRGATAQEAAEGAIAAITERFGADTAGVIVVDRAGRVGAAFDTRGMGRAWARGGPGGTAAVETRVAVWKNEAF
jgi:beta-aspartyl-peptidase (threonine type)